MVVLLCNVQEVSIINLKKTMLFHSQIALATKAVNAIFNTTETVYRAGPSPTLLCKSRYFVLLNKFIQTDANTDYLRSLIFVITIIRR